MAASTVHVPEGSRLRADAPLNVIKLAVARALTAQMDESGWRELALLVDAEDRVVGHGRLLRSLRFGDEDYPGCVVQVVPHVLGLRRVPTGPGWTSWEPPGEEVFLDHLPLLEEHLDLPAWLAEHEPGLHRLLYAADPAQAVALGGLQQLAADTDLPELTQQLARLERDLHADLPAAIGHAKDLVETACKTVLGQVGEGAGGKGPALVDAALRALGRSPATVDGSDADAQLRRKLLGAVSTQLQAVFELRNRVGTGHGRAGSVVLDEPLARLTVGQALTAVTYLLRVHDQQTTQQTAPWREQPP